MDEVGEREDPRGRPVRGRPPRSADRGRPDRPADREGRADRSDRSARSARPARPVRRPARTPEYRRFLARRGAIIGLLLVLTGVTYLVFFTSVLGVRDVAVVGAKTLTADEVRAAAAVEAGSPLIRLDTEAIASRVAALPKVATVDVHRSWPGTIEVVLTERGPSAAFRAPDGVHLIDMSGVDFAVVPTAPAGLPTLEVSRAAADDPSTRAAMSVLTEIPEQLRAQVVTVGAKTPGSVRLTLADGRVVKWGGPEESHRKAAVLGVLLTRPGKVYDVAAPEFPTVA